MASDTFNLSTTLVSDTTKSIKDREFDVFNQVGGITFDFHKMVAVDWDEFNDGEKLALRDYTNWNALNIIRLTLASWILASHLAIITFVLAKQALRSQPKNLLIVNMALVNVLMGVFVIPAKLHFTLNPSNVHCNLAVGWTFITDYYQPSVSLFAILSLVFERFVYMYTEKKNKNVRPWATKIGTVFLMVSSWVIPCIFLLPTFYGGLLAKSADAKQCLYKINYINFLASQLMSFILPALGVFILAPFTCLLDFFRPKRCSYKPLTPKGESLIITAIVSVFSIFCEAPYCFVHVIMMVIECNNSYCSRFSQALTMTMWIRICKAAVFPFIWLAYTDIRDAMLCQLSTGKVTNEDSDDDDDDDQTKFTDDVQKLPLTQSPSKAV